MMNRFLSYFKPLSEQATAKAQTLNQQHQLAEKASNLDAKVGATEKLNTGFSIGKSYYESALHSPFGAKVQAFYTT